MQEVFEKLIKKLEVQKENVLPSEKYLFGNIGVASVEGFNRGIKNAIEIVKQAAEEYATDTNVGTNGWTPVDKELPKGYCHCLVTRRNEYEDGFDTDVREDTYVEIEGIWDWQSKHEGLIDEVIAWQPLPEPYQPKGE